MPKQLNPDAITRLLVRGTNWVGDAVMSLPALKRIRQVFSTAHISLLVVPWVSGIYEGQSYLDEVLLYDRSERHRGISGHNRLIQGIRRSRFDAAILLQNAFEAALLVRLAGIPLRGGYNRDGRGWLLSHPVPVDPRVARLHQTYYYLDMIDQLAGRPRQSLQVLEARESLEVNPLPWPDISITVHPNRRQTARRETRGNGSQFSKEAGRS